MAEPSQQWRWIAAEQHPSSLDGKQMKKRRGSQSSDEEEAAIDRRASASTSYGSISSKNEPSPVLVLPLLDTATGRGSEESSSAAEGATTKRQRVKKTRGANACVMCRRLKVRCVPLEPQQQQRPNIAFPGSPCQRCARLGQECRFDTLPRGVRVSEERTALFSLQQHQNQEGQQPSDSASSRSLSQASAATEQDTSQRSILLPQVGTRELEKYLDKVQQQQWKSSLEGDLQGNLQQGPLELQAKLQHNEDQQQQHWKVDLTSLIPSAISTLQPSATTMNQNQPQACRVPNPTIPLVARPPTEDVSLPCWSPWTSWPGAATPGDALPTNDHNSVTMTNVQVEGARRATNQAAAAATQRLKNKKKRRNVGHLLPSGRYLHPVDMLAEASRSNTDSEPSVEPGSSTSASTSQSGGEKRRKSSAATTVVMSEDQLEQHEQQHALDGRPRFVPFRQGNEECHGRHRLLESGLLLWRDVCRLFDVFFETFAPHFPLLDPVIHSPTFVARRSSLLFAVICTVASRDIDASELTTRTTDTRQLHAQCFAESIRLAGQCLTQGTKSVEVVQGLLLLSMWMPVSMKQYSKMNNEDDDRSWMYCGLAMRIATELGLSEHVARDTLDDMAPPVRFEVVNRQRTWFACYAVDKALSILTGKADMLADDDDLVMQCRSWYFAEAKPVHDDDASRRRDNDDDDDEEGSNTFQLRLHAPWHIFMAGFVDLSRLLSRYIKRLRAWKVPCQRRSSTSQQPQNNQGSHVHFEEDDDHEAKMACIASFNEALDEWSRFWTSRWPFTLPNEKERHQMPDGDARLVHRYHRQWPFRMSYARLMVNSFALQHCLHRRRSRRGKEAVDVGLYFAICWRSARSTLLAARDGMGSASLRFVGNNQLVMITYASVFLLKLVGSEAKLAEYHNGTEAVALVRDVAQMLGNGDGSVVVPDKTHASTVYANFLTSLLASQQSSPSSEELGGGKMAVVSPPPPSLVSPPPPSLVSPPLPSPPPPSQTKAVTATPSPSSDTPTINGVSSHSSPYSAAASMLQILEHQQHQQLWSLPVRMPAPTTPWLSNLQDLPAFNDTLMHLPPSRSTDALNIPTYDNRTLLPNNTINESLPNTLPQQSQQSPQHNPQSVHQPVYLTPFL